MLERLVISLLLVGVGTLAWFAFNQVAIRRLAPVAPADPLLMEAKPGLPTILYFTTPFCEPCRTQQKPALAQLATELEGSVQIIQIDATLQPEAADRWGVFSAPTTFVLDRALTPRHVNRGVAPVDVLRRQLAALD